MKISTRIVALAFWPLMLVGCGSFRPEPYVHPNQYSHPVRVACVGDSITFGAGVENQPSNNYPVVLGRLLGSQYVTKNFGVSGATLLKKGDQPYWKEPAFKAVGQYEPDVVVIKLGTNDSKPQNWKYGADFEIDLLAMIDHFQALPSKPKIWLCLPVPVYEDKWGINEKIVKGEIIPKISQVAAEKHLPVINLYAALSNQPDLFPDQIHPNAAGARVMARTVYVALTGNQPSQ